MVRRSGYEYSYGFRVEDDIISQYSLCLSAIGQDKGFLFEIRTNFKLKRVGDDDDGDMLGSERFGAVVREDEDAWRLQHQTDFRLKDYWMSDEEIQSLVRDALDFAQWQGAAADPSVSVMPVVVGLDVWTVQEEGEPIDAAIDRAIRPECLIPIYVWPVVPSTIMQQVYDEEPYLSRKSLLRELPRIRVEDEAGLAFMEVCPVCSRNSVIGAQISFLPNCNHACHSHCVFNWLQNGNSSCPLCCGRIPTDGEQNREPTPTDVEHLNSDSDSLSRDSGTSSFSSESDSYPLSSESYGYDSDAYDSEPSSWDSDQLSSDWDSDPLNNNSHPSRSNLNSDSDPDQDPSRSDLNLDSSSSDSDSDGSK